MGEGEGDSLWFTYLLNPSKLATDLAAGPSTQKLQLLLKDLLTNLLNNQQAGFFTDNPQELWFAKSRERKSLVLRNLSLQVQIWLLELALSTFLPIMIVIAIVCIRVIVCAIAIIYVIVIISIIANIFVIAIFIVILIVIEGGRLPLLAASYS